VGSVGPLGVGAGLRPVGESLSPLEETSYEKDRKVHFYNIFHFYDILWDREGSGFH
jgi:hypothetical protein